MTEECPFSSLTYFNRLWWWDCNRTKEQCRGSNWDPTQLSGGFCVEVDLFWQVFTRKHVIDIIVQSVHEVSQSLHVYLLFIVKGKIKPCGITNEDQICKFYLLFIFSSVWCEYLIHCILSSPPSFYHISKMFTQQSSFGVVAPNINLYSYCWEYPFCSYAGENKCSHIVLFAKYTDVVFFFWHFPWH